MSDTNIQVTPGYGEMVATRKVGGVHHQRVMTHRDRVRQTVVPSAVGLIYGAGDVIGGEITLSTVMRAVGTTARVTGVTVRAPNGVTPDLRLHFYPSPLTSAPADGSPLAMTRAEFDASFGWLDVVTADYETVCNFSAAGVAPSETLLVGTAAGEASLRVAIESLGALTLETADDLTIVVEFELD